MIESIFISKNAILLKFSMTKNSLNTSFAGLLFHNKGLPCKVCDFIGCQTRNCLTVDVPLGLGLRISVLEPLLSVQICEAAKSRGQQDL